MKQSDFAMLVLIVAISLAASYLLGNTFINTASNREVKVEVVTPVSTEFPVPDETVFVKDFINPTELIQIGDANNTKPFGTDSN